MALQKEQKTEIIEGSRVHETDTGSPEVQIAILTERITGLTDGVSTGTSEILARSGRSYRPVPPITPSIGVPPVVSVRCR